MAGLRSSDERRTLTRRIGNVQGTPWRGSRHQNQRSWPFVPLRRVLHCVRRVAALPTFEPLHNQSSAARGRPSAPEGPLAYSLHEPAQSPAFSVAPSGSFSSCFQPRLSAFLFGVRILLQIPTPKETDYDRRLALYSPFVPTIPNSSFTFENLQTTVMECFNLPLDFRRVHGLPLTSKCPPYGAPRRSSANTLRFLRIQGARPHRHRVPCWYSSGPSDTGLYPLQSRTTPRASTSYAGLVSQDRPGENGAR